MNFKKIILSLMAGLLLIIALVGYKFFNKIYANNIDKQAVLYISTGADFEQVKVQIKPLLLNAENFIWVAKQKNYPNKIKPGRYLLKKGMNNNELVNLLRSGNQTPISITFNNQDSVEKLAGRIAAQLEPDSLTILKAVLEHEFLKDNNLNKNNVIGIFVPNSYEFYWNTSAKLFRDRMFKEYITFWNSDRTKKAQTFNLTPMEVVILASIVQKETAIVKERPVVAGLYLNRLRDRWALQADPTIIFALKQKHGQQFEVKRVLSADLSIDSPFNTYKNLGLPPAPIAMPDISSIEAVLNPERHNYFYMCASVSNLGYHEFARTLAQHNINAIKYQKWVSNQGINR